MIGLCLPRPPVVNIPTNQLNNLPNLLAQTEPPDQRQIALAILALQIGKMATTLTDQLQQTPPRSLIAFVQIEVFDESIDARGQQRYLHFWRACIIFGDSIFPRSVGSSASW
jgi:hypothetical protein